MLFLLQWIMLQQVIFLSRAPQNSSGKEQYLSIHKASWHLQLLKVQGYSSSVTSLKTQVFRNVTLRCWVSSYQNCEGPQCLLCHGQAVHINSLWTASDKGTAIFRNVVKYTLNNAALLFRRLESSVCTSLLTAELLDGEVWDLKQDSRIVSVHKLLCHMCVRCHHKASNSSFQISFAFGN